MTATAIIGRDKELAVLRAFVESDGGPAALLLEGDAGAGKTTLWNAAVEHGFELGLDVRAARPLEPEAKLAFTAVGDLLAGVEGVVDTLPDPQARALRVALLLEPAGGVPPDERAVGLALAAALRGLAAERRLLVAIDDVQWLDGPSARALAFAVRRLEGGEPVRLLLAIRREDRAGLPFDPDRALPSLERLALSALDLDATHLLLLDRLGIAFPRPTVRSLHEVAGGNPFFILELGRALAPELATHVAGTALPVPTVLQELVGARIAVLPPETKEALAAAAALAAPAPALVGAAIGRSPGPALTPAVDAGVIEPVDDRIRFAHPLLAAAAYHACPSSRRRELHRALADAVAEPERAHHLALATAAPSAEIAAEIEAAAQQARARGAPLVAAELAEHAVRLTPPDRPHDMRRRASDGAFWLFEAGDTRRARTLLEEVLAATGPGVERTRLLLRLARIRSYDDDIRAARDLFLAAIDEAEAEPEVLCEAHEGVAATSFRLRDRLAEAVTHACAAAALADGLGRPDLRAEALADQALSEAALGRAEAVVTLEAAMRLGNATEGMRVMRRPAFQQGVIGFWHDDLDGARERFLELRERAAEMDDESSVPYILVMLGQIECVRGRLREALAIAGDGLEHARQAGQETLVGYLLAVVAWTSAHLGAESEARAAAAQALDIAQRTSGVPAYFFATAAVGLLELTLGEARAAHDRLAPLVALVREQGIDEPGTTRFVADDVEALVALGRIDEAVELLDWYEGNAERLARCSAQALSLRGRGLLASAAGDVPAAVDAFERALVLHDAVDIPFDKARTLLALGAAQRRLKERRAARATLERALGGFEALDARTWAIRATAELGRIGGRTAAGAVLTPVEQRVAELVASGRTNREVATALFLSVRTVEGHLSRIYGKLGVRSRVELAKSLDVR